MFEEGVGGVISTERCAERTYPDAGCPAHGVDEGEDFVRHIGVVLRLHPTAMEGVRALICERIALHAIDAEDSDSPLVEVGAEGANHALTFLFPLVAHAGGEGEDGQTVMVAVHGWQEYRVDGRAQARLRDDRLLRRSGRRYSFGARGDDVKIIA